GTTNGWPPPTVSDQGATTRCSAETGSMPRLSAVDVFCPFSRLGHYRMFLVLVHPFNCSREASGSTVSNILPREFGSGGPPVRPVREFSASISRQRCNHGRHPRNTFRQSWNFFTASG